MTVVATCGDEVSVNDFRLNTLISRFVIRHRHVLDDH